MRADFGFRLLQFLVITFLLLLRISNIWCLYDDREGRKDIIVNTSLVDELCIILKKIPCISLFLNLVSNY